MGIITAWLKTQVYERIFVYLKLTSTPAEFSAVINYL